jgi:hypothetical protein
MVMSDDSEENFFSKRIADSRCGGGFAFLSISIYSNPFHVAQAPV